jgi:hypothetical protein
MRQNNSLSYLIGLIIGILHVFIVFGTNLDAGSKASVNINIYPFIKDSRVIIFNSHIHHWLIYFILFLLTFYIDSNSIGINTCLLHIIRSYSIVLVYHGLLYSDRFDFNV